MNKIAYKVVRTKNGKRVSIFSNRSKYLKLYYDKGKIVKAKRSTEGVFVFNTKENAMHFCGTICVTNYKPKSFTIIKVKPIGKRTVPSLILLSSQGIVNYYFYHKWMNYYSGLVKPPTGTICYPAVEVLE